MTMYYKAMARWTCLHCFASEEDAGRWELRNIDRMPYDVEPTQVKALALKMGEVICHYPAKPEPEWETPDSNWWPTEMIDAWTIRWRLLSK